MTTATTVTIIVGHNVGDVPTHDTLTVCDHIRPLLAEVFTVAEGSGSYREVGGTIIGEACTVLVGTVYGPRSALAGYLANVAQALGQESIGLVWNATGDDSLVFAD